jgi:QueT transporter
MTGFLDSLGQFFSAGATAWFVVALVVWIAINIFIVGGWLGWTVLPFERFSIARFRQGWGPKALAVAALAGALKVVLQFASSPLVIVPGVLTFRLDNLVAVALGLIVGPAAVWGLMFGNIVGDLLAGTLNLGSIGGALANFFGNLLIFVMVTDPRFRRGLNYVQFIAFVIVQAIGVTLYLAVWFDFVNLMPSEVIWTAVVPSILIAVPPSVILAPILIKILYPLMDRWGLTAHDVGFRWLTGPRVHEPVPTAGS